MALIEALLQELEHEAQTTRRVLDRVPGDRLAWKPHDRSMSLGQLALHVATVPGNVAELAAMDIVPVPPSFVQPEAARASELVPSLRESVAKARRTLGADSARPRDHAESLVPPPRPAARLPADAESVRAVGLRPERRREPLRR
jgi:hypothetical protein